MNRCKLLRKILGGLKEHSFWCMVSFVEGFGFSLSRTDGSHHIFVHSDVPELVNL